MGERALRAGSWDTFLDSAQCHVRPTHGTPGYSLPHAVLLVLRSYPNSESGNIRLTISSRDKRSVSSQDTPSPAVGAVVGAAAVAPRSSSKMPGVAMPSPSAPRTGAAGTAPGRGGSTACGVRSSGGAIAARRAWALTTNPPAGASGGGCDVDDDEPAAELDDGP